MSDYVYYTVTVGEVGNDQGRIIGRSGSLRGAKCILTRNFKQYVGAEGWGIIRVANQATRRSLEVYRVVKGYEEKESRTNETI